MTKGERATIDRVRTVLGRAPLSRSSSNWSSGGRDWSNRASAESMHSRNQTVGLTRKLQTARSGLKERQALEQLKKVTTTKRFRGPTRTPGRAPNLLESVPSSVLPLRIDSRGREESYG